MEIAILEDLIRTARAVRHQGEDKKWVQLRAILDQQLLENSDSGQARKIIVFTEHRDTLDYLQRRITAQFGRADSVITIHGGTSREDRKRAREQFTHDPETAVLLATDAAGEGLNLQRAHLMVNYDLPWNPNRLEQRFGRIHRIGQREVCHLWNMVARDTREGDVFAKLLSKIDQMEQAYNGNLFNVLGESGAFQERSLRDLLIEAIRYGDQPEVKQKLDRIIDSSVSDGLNELVAERTLHPEMFSALSLDEIKERMEESRARRLQPGYIAAFFIPAFMRLGGQIRKREKGRYEIVQVPARIVETARRLNRWAPVAQQYERVTFELELVRLSGSSPAALIAPGHPLLQAVIELIISDMGTALAQGTVLVDRRAEQDRELMLLYTVEQRIRQYSEPDRAVSHHFDYALLRRDGHTDVVSAPPYLDFDPPKPDELDAIDEVLKSEWVRQDHESAVRGTVYRNGALPRLAEVRTRIGDESARVRSQVMERLLAEINHWDSEHNRLADLERAGTVGRIRAESAYARARALDSRLEGRLAELDALSNLVADSPVVRGLALVVPRDLLDSGTGEQRNSSAEARELVERRAVDAVLAAERALGRTPVEQVRNNPGFDIRSTSIDGEAFFIEVKGRIEGADIFTITTNEVSFAQTQGARHRLALVKVSSAGPERDELRYVSDAFAHIEPSTSTRSLNEVWEDYWSRGGPPT
ncbi:helicase-related protein [Populibacterium corticicola]|uniref:Helicase-related protein n=1 Tax=Populibacterium corticicola TaxID=1812826 RepID=A0ABW5XAK1_9MICO